MTRVTVVDYGASNMLSVCRALCHVGADIEIAENEAALDGASRVIVPGVGAFGDAMARLAERGLVGPLRDYAATGRPLLGICLGMQMMMESSDEFGTHSGLGLIPGRVARIADTGADGTPHPVPHIGWNALIPPAPETDWSGTVLAGTPSGTHAYFVHSFMAAPTVPDHVLAVCDYDGCALVAAVRRDNVSGCQFHPEKSGPAGLAMLAAFLELAP